MKQKRLHFLLLFLLLAVVACSGVSGGEPAFTDTLTGTPSDPNQSVSSDDPTPTAHAEEPAADAEETITGQAQVESIEIMILESFPVQIHASIAGYLGDGCTTLGSITTTQEGNTFFVQVTTQRPAEAMCTQQLVGFQESVVLDVYGLAAGTYTIDANGVTNTFVLEMDNVPFDEETGEGDAPTLTLSPEDTAELIHLTLERALVAKEIPDYGLLTAEQDDIVLSTENIPAALVPELPGITLILLTPEQIQSLANEKGDFLYLRFSEITALSDTQARVALDNTWMRAEDSQTMYLSGGGFVMEFTKTATGWIGEVTEAWIS